MYKVREKKILSHTKMLVFDVIFDIESYPKYLPWCQKLRVLEKEMDHILAKMHVGYGFLSESFTTRVTWVGTDEIHFNLESGPFKHLEGIWKITALDDNQTEISFSIDFAFTNGFIDKMFGPFFHEAQKRMIHAFEKRLDYVARLGE